MRKIIALFVLLVSLLPLTARDIYSLNDGWQFFFKHENESENARIVTLPHSWNTDPQAGAQFNETTANYLRDVFLPEEWSSKRLFVKFYGAQSVASKSARTTARTTPSRSRLPTSYASARITYCRWS